MKELAADGWPTKIVLEERLHTSGMPAKAGLTLVSCGILMLTAMATQGAFIRYFETWRPAVVAKAGTNPTVGRRNGMLLA